MVLVSDLIVCIATLQSGQDRSGSGLGDRLIMFDFPSSKNRQSITDIYLEPESTPVCRRHLRLVSHHDIADHLRLTIETVSRAITGMARPGLIGRVLTRQLIIRNEMALERVTR